MFRMCMGGGDHRLLAEPAEDMSRSMADLLPFIGGPEDHPLGSVMPPPGLGASRLPGEGG